MLKTVASFAFQISIKFSQLIDCSLTQKKTEDSFTQPILKLLQFFKRPKLNVSFQKLMLFAACLSAARAGVLAPVAPVAVAAKLADSEFDPNPQYSFAYDVQDTLTGDSKSQIESRSGNVVQGQYTVVDPDGTRRIVDYTADPINGFNAVVQKQPLVKAVAPVAAPVVAAPVAAPVVAAPAPVAAARFAAPVAAPLVAAPAVARVAAPLAYPAPALAAYASAPYAYPAAARVAAPYAYAAF